MHQSSQPFYIPTTVLRFGLASKLGLQQIDNELVNTLISTTYATYSTDKDIWMDDTDISEELKLLERWHDLMTQKICFETGLWCKPSWQN